MRPPARIVGLAVFGLFLVLSGGWGALFLWFALPGPDELRAGLAFGYCALAILCIVLIGRGRSAILSVALYFVAMAVLMAWWVTIEPQNDRDWQRDVAKLPWAKVDGDFVTIYNIRNFEYRTETDYTPRWYDKTIDLRNLNGLDLIAVYWMGDAIAHTMLSFDFGGAQIAISIEIRKEKGEAFSALAGFFRRYELTYVVGDERDLIGLRTNFRKPEEDVYIYRTKANPARVRNLFLQYIQKINELRSKPEFYNSATTNCTTNILTHTNATERGVPFSWKVLLSGFFPNLIYERGALDQSLPFDILRRRSLINERAQAAGITAGFSRKIRRGLIGMPN